jgi:site-specific recombinase XerD
VPIVVDHAGTDLELIVGFEDTMAGLSPLTARGRIGAVLRFARWLEPARLVDATTGDISRWLDSLDLAASTRSDRVAALHRFYNWLVNEGTVDRDPAAPLTRQRRPVDAGDFPAIARGFWIAQERKALAPSTITARALQLRLFFDWLAPRSIVDATTADIELWLDGRRLGPKARYRAISNLHMFYTWARREGLVGVDPTERIDRPRLPVGVPRPISDEHLARAIAEAGPVTRAILCVAAFEGLRAKEIAGLRREDILDQLDEPMLIVAAPKGRRERTVPLHPVAWEAIAAAGPPRSGYLFAYRNRKPWPAWKVSQTANGHLGRLQIPSTLHKLRHWYATRVYAASLDLRLTQELLGHSSPTTTAVYTAYSKAKATEVVGTLTLDSPPRLRIAGGS